MDIRILIILVYLLAMGVVGIVFRRVSSRGAVEYFLAGRRIGPILLFCTMAATNFSAFTIFGLSGAGYRIGYAYWPVMGFGTGFMALCFVFIGGRVTTLAKERGWLTPPDVIAGRYGAPWLAKLVSVVMILYTLPYVAIQAVSAGRSLETIAGIPYTIGVLLVTGSVILYVTLGGMRSVAWTDVVQALMMLLLTAAGYFIVVHSLGGFIPAHERTLANDPALLSRPGLDGSLTPGAWIGWLFLWFFADPMFPQLFQRFIAARDRRSLATTAALYPLATTALFFLTVSLGVLGRGVFPGLTAQQSESIYPMLLARFAGPVLSTLLLTGGLAALMSTLDSQLLTLTSLFTVDLVGHRGRRVALERLVTIAIGVVGTLIALAQPPATIFDFVNRTTFNGLAALAPTFIGALYWKRATRWGAGASIVAGELAVVAFYLGWVSVPGTLPAVPIVALAAAVFVLVSLATPPKGGDPEIARPVDRRSWILVAPFVALLALANDFWAWGRSPTLALGLPLWVWYFAGLGVLLSIAVRFLLRDQWR